MELNQQSCSFVLPVKTPQKEQIMSTVVTARVPEGVRARGVDILHEIGSSTSELINAAFEYVIKERKLPKPQSQPHGEPLPRTIGREQLAQATSFMESVRVAVPDTWENAPFEDLLDSTMEERYAHLR